MWGRSKTGEILYLIHFMSLAAAELPLFVSFGTILKLLHVKSNNAYFNFCCLDSLRPPATWLMSITMFDTFTDIYNLMIFMFDQIVALLCATDGLQASTCWRRCWFSMEMRDPQQNWPWSIHISTAWGTQTTFLSLLRMMTATTMQHCPWMNGSVSEEHLANINLKELP